MASGSSNSTTTGQQQQQQQQVGSSQAKVKAKEFRGRNSRGALLLLLTSGFFITGLLFDYMPIIIDSQIKRTMELATNEEIQSIWARPPVDLHSYYWLYDITNPDQFMVGERAKIRKVGPFHFTSRLEKSIVEVSKNKYRLSYNSTRRIKFNESEQSEPLDEPLHLLNPIYVGMLESSRQFAESMDDQGKFVALTSVQRLAAKFNETLVIKTSARSALIGRRVELLSAARKMISTLGLNFKLPAALDNNVFGYVAVQNNTWSGPTEIYTGYQASMSSLGDIISHLGQRRLTHFRGRCNRLQASAGELRPMPIGEDQQLEIFRPELCRIIRLQPTGVQQLREGRAISFRLAQEDFASAQSNPDNRCFCINSTSSSNNNTNDFCSLDGVIELAPCLLWTPLVLNVGGIQIDPKITSTIQDWDQELLQSDVELLPKYDPKRQLLILKRLGVPIRVDLTITMFMKVIRDSRYRETKSLPEVSYVPLLMARELATIPPNLAGIIVNLESFLALSQHVKLVMYLSAIVLLCWLTGHYYNRATQDQTTIRPSDENGRHPSAQSGNSSGNHRTERGKRTTRSISTSQPADLSPAELINSSSSTINTSTTQVVDEDVQTGQDTSSQKKTPEMISTNKGLHQPALIFSKVDELRGLQRQERTPAFEQAAGGTGAEQQEVANSVMMPEVPEITGGDSKDVAHRKEESEKQTTESDEYSSEGAKNGVGDEHAHSLRRKNWFVNVYSNFMRMLTDIRTTISDASQLDVSANDYQDKQLEMLAGKIDNWQRFSSNSPVEDSTPASMVAPKSENLNDDPSRVVKQQDEEEKEEEQQQQLKEDDKLKERVESSAKENEMKKEDENSTSSSVSNTTTTTNNINNISNINNNNNNDSATENRADFVQEERESVHSSQTIIQKSCLDDKERALEQMERALWTSIGLPKPTASGIELHEKELNEEEAADLSGIERPKLMINSASGTDSPPELELHIAATIVDASLAQSPAARISNGKPLNEHRIDESAALQDLEKLSEASGAGGCVENKSEDASDNNDTIASFATGKPSSSSSSVLASNSSSNLVRQVAKDERRDSGVKLDSSSSSNNNLSIHPGNGISGKELDASANLETVQNKEKESKKVNSTTSTQLLFEDQLLQAEDKQEKLVAEPINSNNNNNNNNSNSNSNNNNNNLKLQVTHGNNITTTISTTDLKIQQQQQLQSRSDFLRQSKQIREGDTINDNGNFSLSARTKLLNGDANSNGNHISNGKIILLRQTNERVGTIDC